jgi:hypothetical protein
VGATEAVTSPVNAYDVRRFLCESIPAPMTTPAETIGHFTPKLVTVLREGYGAQQFKADALAGLTVAIVALPLSMAIAIGSGAKPEHGLYSAIVGGFVISALGGSPTGAPWFCDAAVFSAKGMPSIALGPGSIAQAHTADEWISTADLEEGADFFERFLRSLA